MSNECKGGDEEKKNGNWHSRGALTDGRHFSTSWIVICQFILQAASFLSKRIPQERSLFAQLTIRLCCAQWDHLQLSSSKMSFESVRCFRNPVKVQFGGQMLLPKLLRHIFKSPTLCLNLAITSTYRLYLFVFTCPFFLFFPVRLN